MEESVVRTSKSAIRSSEDFEPGLAFLVGLVKQIRPRRAANKKEATENFKAVLHQVREDKQILLLLKRSLFSQFSKTNFVPALIESGMPASRGFVQELIKKVKHRILPPLLHPANLLYVINNIFYRKDDDIWVKSIGADLWLEFFELLEIKVSFTDNRILRQLNEALHILIQRTVTLGLEKEIMGNYIDINYRQYSFFILDTSVQEYLTLYESEAQPEEITNAVSKITEAIQNCQQTIKKISELRRENGTSLSQTYILTRIEQHFDRVLVITDLLNSYHHFDAKRFLDYFIQVINYEKNKNSITNFLNTNLSFLTYKITEHSGRRGKKYITATRRDYWQILKASMGGGFIVSFTAVIKNLISKVAMPPFWLGFTYSINYAIGFQLMHETGSTLATKQPAYTASAIAATFDNFEENRKPNLYAVAIIIARTSRTQLASFFGNLIIVFPLAYCLAALYRYLTGHYILSTDDAIHTLRDQHPYLSLSVLYACFTGLALFLSGLIAGYVENGINYGRVGERLKKHPLFKNILEPKKLEKVSRYVEDNMGALVGNVALGFLLGMAGFVGKIFGIPFDIRHITISSGNAAIAYYTTGNTPGTTFLATVFAGILLIGLFNFLVSFALAFFVAIRSRGIRLKDYPELVAIVTKFFVKFPLDFFFPAKHQRKIDDVKRRFG